MESETLLVEIPVEAQVDVLILRVPVVSMTELPTDNFVLEVLSQVFPFNKTCTRVGCRCEYSWIATVAAVLATVAAVVSIPGFLSRLSLAPHLHFCREGFVTVSSSTFAMDGFSVSVHIH